MTKDRLQVVGVEFNFFSQGPLSYNLAATFDLAVSELFQFVSVSCDFAIWGWIKTYRTTMHAMNIHSPAILVFTRVGCNRVLVHSNFLPSSGLEVFKYIKEKGSISNADLDAALGPVAKIGSLAGHGAWAMPPGESLGRPRSWHLHEEQVGCH